MNIDLHVHCLERSKCGLATEHEQIAAARAAGLDAFAFTDHNQLVPPDRLRDLNQTYAPFRIFGGVELDVEGEHLVVIGLQDERLVAGAWAYADLHAYVRENKGFMFLAHPFRFRNQINVDIELLPPDAIEVRSCSTPLLHQARIRELAVRLGMKPMCNSDAHCTDYIGLFYNILADTPSDDRSLVECLRKGMAIYPDDSTP